MQGPSGSVDDRFKQWWAPFMRLVASPGAYRELGAILGQIDVRAVLPLIQAQTLVLHRDRPRCALVLKPQRDVRNTAVSPDRRWVVTCSYLPDPLASVQVWKKA